MSKDKYKAFTNYMHNELGISKEDIRTWTKEAVYEVAETYVQNQLNDRSVDQRIMSIIRDNKFSIWDRGDKTFDQTIRQGVIKELVSQVELDVNVLKLVKKSKNSGRAVGNEQ